MCGIAGIVHLDPAEPVDSARLLRMRDILRHRGPDDQGTWTEGPVGLGHRRLSIVDVAGGRQPMCNGDGSIVIVFNGEIYNHPELRAELESRGHRYRTHSDTETILHLYEEKQDYCVEDLQGMFAFALWDRRRNCLMLARDRLGIKPLYLAVTPNEIAFASEIKAILAAESVRASFRRSALPEFLATRFIAGQETFFEGIRKLLPGHVLLWNDREGFRERRYWSLPDQYDRPVRSLDEEAEDLHERLREVVRHHLMSDVPLGVFLSGGLDSSALAVLMKDMVEPPLRTFSVGFHETDANELPYARLVARAIGADHHEVLVTPEEFFAALPGLVWHEDEPIAFPSSVPLFFVSRLARDFVKVVLTGEGSDELFLGYNWYRMTAWNARWGRMYWRFVPATIREFVRRAIDAAPPSLRRYGSRTFLGMPSGFRHLLYENFATFPETWRRRLLLDESAADPFVGRSRHFDAAPGSFLRRMSDCDLQTYLVELLMKQDQMSMAASIESRVPFLDHELVESVATLPDRLKIRGWTTKVILRRAVASLVPREVLTRPKMGFPVPLGRWFRGPAASLLDDVLLAPRTCERQLLRTDGVRRLVAEHRSGRVEHGERLWLLLNLEIWMRIFIDGEPPGDVLAKAA